MPNCAAVDCLNRQCGESEKTFHLFPFSRPEILKQWLANMKREFWTPSKRSVLCSDHFGSSCFDRTGCTTRIRSDAVPTIFDSAISQKNENKPKLERKKKKTKELQAPGENDENREVTASFAARYSKRKRTLKSFDPDFVYEEEFIKRQRMNAQPPVTSHQKASPPKFLKRNVTAYSTSKISDKLKLSPVVHLKRIKTNSHQSIAASCLVNSEPAGDVEVVKEFASDSESSLEPNHIIPNEETGNQEKDDLEKVRQVSAMVHKITSKDKVTHLPNNFIHFEFATPRRQVILELNSKAENSGLRCNSLSDLMNSLREKNLLTFDGEELMNAFGDIPAGLLKINSKKDLEKLLDRQSSEEVKMFSSLLYLNSRGSYDIVNETFLLPNSTILRKRLQTENFWPGFTKEALEIINIDIRKTQQEILCCVMFDFISIKKECYYETTWEKWMGHVDLGRGQTPSHGDGIPLANEVLIFTAVGLGRDWKLPFGYFLSKGLSPEILKNLLLEAIYTLEEYGLKVKAVVCNGSRSTVKLANLLSCSVHPDISNNIETSFPHPCDQNERIYFVFSVGHTLVLLKNLLADKGTLQSSVYGEIKWNLVKQLIFPAKKMELDSSHLSPSHLEFYHLENIIKNCGSVFNSTVTAALLIAETLKLKNFDNCRNTYNFIADITRTFDLLNARNPVSSEDRPPIHWTTMQEQIESLLNLSDRILALELISGKRIISDGRWMSVALLAFTLKSVSQLASELLKNKTVLYLCTFRINLDHSDMIINHLQRHGCWNDVPTPSGFRNAYKNLFMKSRWTSFYHNDFDGEDLTIGQGDIYLYRKNFRSDPVRSDNYVMHSSSLVDLKVEEDYKAKCLLEILTKRLSCPDCMAIIVNKNISVNSSGGKCGIRVSRPSKFLFNILKYSETILNVLMIEESSLTIEDLVAYVFSEFCNLQKAFSIQKLCQIHFVEEPFHIICLVKVVIRTFISLRKHERRKKVNAGLQNQVHV